MKVFKESAIARTYLRAAVAALLGVAAAAGTIWVDNPYAKLASIAAGVFGGYIGIGAASGSVEPFYGRQLENAEVPSPPAVADNEEAA